MRHRLAVALLMLGPVPAAAASLSVEGTRFVVTTDGGRTLSSEQLVGAVLDMETPEGAPARVRIDAVFPAPDNKDVLLHDLRVEGPDGSWRPICDPDAKGGRAAFPIAGAWDGRRFVPDKARWFLTCTSGAQAKFRLWGFDPWANGPDGRSLAPLYQACQHMVRADYRGDGAAYTRNGTIIDAWDIHDKDGPATASDPAFAFEAGWGPDGAVCVARTRWPDLLALAALIASAPQLSARPCDEAEARRRGALMFNRSKLRP